MKVAAVIGVKNEADLIPRTIEHCYNIGVDSIVVADYQSNDGTEKILQRLASPRLKTITINESQNLAQDAWGEEEARIAKSTGADWVIFLDADEFWLPASGSIKEALSRVEPDVLTVRRFNVPLIANSEQSRIDFGADNYPEILLYAQSGGRKLQEILRENPSAAWVQGVPLPKIAVRPDKVKLISAGDHNAVLDNGQTPERTVAQDIIIAHLPFSTYERFQKKIRSIRETLIKQAAYHEGNTAWHWKRWIELDEAGQLYDEYMRQALSMQDIDQLRISGNIMSAADLLAARPPQETESHPAEPRPMNDDIKVSVHMPAYNHEDYIAEAIESALMQKVNFNYEIVIGDDCSTDGTVKVARAYAEKYPSIVNLIEHPKNLGIWENDQQIIAACRGQYIAWLEADDYWTSQDKLQRQVDFLDQHPDYSAIFHRAGCKSDSIEPVTWKGAPPVIKQDYTIDDLLELGHFAPSCTAVIRADLLRQKAEWTRATPFLETTYFLRFAQAGKIRFIDEEMAVFRYHSRGVYGRTDAVGNIKAAIATHELAGSKLALTGMASYKKGLSRLYNDLGKAYFAKGKALSGAVSKIKAAWYRLA